jgi:phytanoyl-CoA hydroxylase
MPVPPTSYVIGSAAILIAILLRSVVYEDCGYAVGDKYKVCSTTVEDFNTRGLAIINDVVSEKDLLEIEAIYDQYMAEGSREKQGRDFCDMSKPYDTPREEYSVINAMLPRRYYPALQGNAYERVAANIAQQLFPGAEMILDYDQLLDKNPGAADAQFAWHQDMAYWPSPAMTPDTRTVTFSLAMDTTTKENGCIRYVAGSGVDKVLRNHKPLGKTKADAHAIALTLRDDEEVSYAQVKRGSVSVHDEYVVHGSGGNTSKGKRRTYVIAFRVKDTVERERAAGFTHSHNDEVNWDVFNNWDNTHDK